MKKTHSKPKTTKSKHVNHEHMVKIYAMVIAVVAILAVAVVIKYPREELTPEEMDAQEELEGLHQSEEGEGFAGQVSFAVTKTTYLSCSDTDAGKDPSRLGTVKVIYMSGGRTYTRTFSDSCVSGKLKEYYCNGDRHAYENYDCTCESGVCRPSYAGGGTMGAGTSVVSTTGGTMGSTGATVPTCTPESCNDGIDCTLDTCLDNRCVNNPINTRCDDDNPCTEESCDRERGCIRSQRTGSCNDNNVCTVSSTCEDGVCVPGQRLTCDDGDPCTENGCNPTTGCYYNPISNCDTTEGCGVGHYYPYGDTRYCLDCPPRAECSGGAAQPRFY